MNDWLAWGYEIWLWFRQLLVEHDTVLTRDNTVPTIANLIGYVSVIAVGIWGYRAVEKRLRKEHTVDFLLRLWITPDFAEGLHILDNHIAKDLFVVEDRLKEDDAVGNSKSLDMLMNFYEFIAPTYRKSYLDKVGNMHFTERPSDAILASVNSEVSNARRSARSSLPR